MNIASVFGTSLTGSEQGVYFAFPSFPSWISFPFLRKSRNIKTVSFRVYFPLF